MQEHYSLKTPKNPAQKTKFLNERKKLTIARDNLENNLGYFQRQIKELLDETDSRNRQIDDLHSKANELAKANLEYEQKLLGRFEKAYEKTPQNIKEAAVIKARADVGKVEAKINNALQKQVREKREAEQKSMEGLKALPSIRQEIVTTRIETPTGKEVLKQKRIIERRVPMTTAEKTKRMLEEEKESAKERKAIRAQVKKGLSLQQMETEVKKLRAAAEQSRKQGKEKQAKRQEKFANELEKQLESKRQTSRMAMVGVKEKSTARPPKMLTGVAKETKKKEKIDYEQEARDAGVSREDYEFVQRGLMYGFKARAEEGVGGGVTRADVDKVIKETNIPKGLDIIVLDTLPETLQELIRKQGVDPRTTRAGVMANGKVFIVVDNHKDIKDVRKSVAHELIGHIGVEGLLGEKGMADLVKKVSEQKGGVWELAKKLGEIGRAHV